MKGGILSNFFFLANFSPAGSAERTSHVSVNIESEIRHCEDVCVCFCLVCVSCFFVARLASVPRGDAVFEPLERRDGYGRARRTEGDPGHRALPQSKQTPLAPDALKPM